MKKVIWILFIVLCISVGLYPYAYFILERTFGLLASKPEELLQDVFWNAMFYTHILLGGFALMIGWAQFSSKWRIKYLDWHRRIGKAYVIAVILSGSASIYIAFYATGGVIAKSGFFCLGVIWLYTTLRALAEIRKGKMLVHQRFMIYSYAACFAAVTLRIWLPILSSAFGSFIPAYRLVAWLCWVPNMIVAYFMVKNLKRTNI